MKTLLLYLIILLSIFNHQTIIYENQLILNFFLYQLLPSLFLLCVLIQIIPLPSIKNYSIPFINIDLFSLFLILKMILIGIPTSSYIIEEYYLQNQLTAKQAHRFIYCISIPSISFMLMTLSFMLTLPKAILIFSIHIFSSFILLFFTRKQPLTFTYQIKEKKLKEAIIFTIKSMSMILAYLFVITSLKSIIIIYFPLVENYVHLFFEFSSGMKHFIHNPYLLFICLGFNGLCAHLQIMNGCDSLKIQYLPFLFFRLIHSLLNVIIYYIFQYFI